MSPLENLISRLEEAFEEDSELDLLIAQAVGNTSRPAPTYTGSLDAAMTLVPSGYAISLHVDANLTVHAGCELDEGEGCSDAQPCGDTPALALCIVALRARSAPQPGAAGMSDPRPYDLSNPAEMIRLYREVSGYMQTCAGCGTDISGRRHALDALKRLQCTTPPAASTGEVERLTARVAELESALSGVLPFMEAAEGAGLVGDEGCLWPVEIVRAALSGATREVLKSPRLVGQDEDECEAFILRFSDPDMRDLAFSGFGARDAAQAAFAHYEKAWTAQLYQMIRRTGDGPLESDPHDPAAAEEQDSILRRLIDLTWGAAFEDESVPSRDIQDRLIARLLPGATREGGA